MLEAKVALLAVALLLGQDDDDTNETALGGTVVTSTINYQFAQTNRVDIASGRTRVSAETGFIAPMAGYAMLRIFIDNSTGPRGTVALTFRANNGQGSIIRQSVEVLEGERRLVVMPVMAQMNAGRLDARGPGIAESVGSTVYFSAQYAGQDSVISIGSSDDTERFLNEKPNNSRASATIAPLKPSEAPSDGIAYLGVQAILIPKAQTLTQLNEAQRNALETYVATGGRLLIPRSAQTHPMFVLTKELKPGPNAYGMGRVQVAMDDTALPSDWQRGTESSVNPWGAPPEYMRRRGNLGDVLLPQATAPLGRFLLIITAFTLLIGPGSVWVARRRGPAALLITIPATAFVTCVFIVGYSAIADGFTVHGATYGYTLLDRQRNRAITAGVTGYYANLSPRGATFSASTGVIGPSGENREIHPIGFEFANGQKFGSDFLPSRTYREWGFLAVEPSRARLTVAAKGDGFVVRNALGADIDVVTVKLHGDLFHATSIRDGGEATLIKGGTSDLLTTRADGRFAIAVKNLSTGTIEDQQFVAKLDGTPFVPSGGLSLDMHAAQSIVRGEVEP